MNNYHITFYFSDKINFETNVASELPLNDFILDFAIKVSHFSQSINDIM